MIIPGFVFNAEVKIEEFQGRTSTGVVYRHPYIAPCYIQPIKEQRKKGGVEGGVTNVPRAKAIFPPTVNPPVGSKVTYGTDEFIILSTVTQMTPAGPHHIEVEMG